MEPHHTNSAVTAPIARIGCSSTGKNQLMKERSGIDAFSRVDDSAVITTQADVISVDKMNTPLKGNEVAELLNTPKTLPTIS
jgi:hypothetical protein